MQDELAVIERRLQEIDEEDGADPKSKILKSRQLDEDERGPRRTDLLAEAKRVLRDYGKF